MLGQSPSWGFVAGPLSVSNGCLNCHDVIRPVGSNAWVTCKYSTERLSEEPARQQVRVKGRKEQRWETSSLRTCLRKRSCFGYGWPRVVFSLPGEWGVLSCVLALRFPASSSNTSFSLNLPRWELVLATKSILRRQMERKRKSGLRSGESMNKDMVVEKKNTTWENIRGKWKIKTGYLNTKARLQKA